MKITITGDVDDDYADPDHEMGVTNEGYEAILGGLSGILDDIDIKRGDA